MVNIILVAVFLGVVIYYFFFKNKTNGFSFTKEGSGIETIDDKFNAKKLAREKELDALLEKISNKGMEALSEKEKARLKELSN